MSRRKRRKTKFPCEICGTVTFLHEHHIRGREIPNANSKGNLVDVCANCHNEIHHGDLIVEGWLMTTGGRELFWHRKEEKSFSGEDAKVHIFGEQNKSDSTEPLE